jgi:hypothetical protein
VILERSGHFKVPYDAPVIMEAYHSENDQPHNTKDQTDFVVSRPSWCDRHTLLKKKNGTSKISFKCHAVE